MTRFWMTWFGGGLLVGLTLLLSSCGACVLGQGDCAQDLTSTTLALKSSATTVSVSSNLTFTTSGGTATYTYTVIVGGGSVSPTTGTSTTFTAQSAAGYGCVRVTDANNNTADRCVSVL
jgi:hypothetical protein